jgi:phage terminase large subunit-like protein
MDLAPKIDTSALVLVFPPQSPGGKWRILEYFWCPEANIADRCNRDHVPYDVWSKDGFIEPTPGDLTDVRYIAEQLAAIEKQFDLKEIAYDSAWSSELIRMLGESEFPMQKLVAHPQTPIKMNPACNDLMLKVLRHEIAHDNNPVMRWQMSNLRWFTQRTAQFIRPNKDRKREKVDGCSALIMALSRAIDPENQIKPKKKFFMVQST